MSKSFTITREIGIDAGHRVMTHGSKCKNLHGHRYKIQVTCIAESGLIPHGEQEGMVLDFGFLKGLMMDHIDTPCDHGMIMSVEDPLLERFGLADSSLHITTQMGINKGYYEGQSKMGKIYIVNFIPTAENLAAHWYERLHKPIIEASGGFANIDSVVVHETPNCKAEYNER